MGLLINMQFCMYASLLVHVGAVRGSAVRDDLDEHSEDAVVGMLGVEEEEGVDHGVALADHGSNASLEEARAFGAALSQCGASKGCDARECCVANACQLHSTLCRYYGLNGIIKREKEPHEKFFQGVTDFATSFAKKLVPEKEEPLKAPHETPNFKVKDSLGRTFFLNIRGVEGSSQLGKGGPSMIQTVGARSGSCMRWQDIPEWVPCKDVGTMCGFVPSGNIRCRK